MSEHLNPEAGSVEMSADSPTQVGMTDARLATTEEANEAAASYVRAPMTDERLAELENYAEPGCYVKAEYVRELVAEVRRLQQVALSDRLAGEDMGLLGLLDEDGDAA